MEVQEEKIDLEAIKKEIAETSVDILQNGNAPAVSSEVKLKKKESRKDIAIEIINFEKTFVDELNDEKRFEERLNKLRFVKLSILNLYKKSIEENPKNYIYQI